MTPAAQASVKEGFSPLESQLTRRAVEGGEPLVADGVPVAPAVLLAAARALAARLAEDGIEKGDFVVLRMRNCSEYLASALGVMFAGAILVPVNARLTTAEIAVLFDACAPRAWIADPESAEALRAAEGAHAPDRRYTIDADPERPLREILTMGRPGTDGPVVRIDPDDTGTVFFTAGTTGDPKGALTSHRAIAAFADILRSDLGMTADDRVILPMPMFYSGGLKSTIANVLIGSRLVVFRKWRSSDLVDAMGEHDGTFLYAVPSVWALMLKSEGFDPKKVENLRVMWRGGSHTPPAIVEALVDLFPGRAHLHSYGQTECNIAAMERDALTHPESVGFPTVGSAISIEGGQQREVEGEVWLRGPQQFSGYLATPGTGDRAAVQDGWVRSGDRGWFDATGRLRIVGRGSDVIIRGGENISAAEVEQAIVRLDGVAEAAVVPVPDDLFGQELRAIVVFDGEPSLTPDAIRERCGAVLAGFKVPKYVEIRADPLPKSPVGKIVKRDL